MIELEARILAKNDARAQKNRAWFRGREILALNLVSSPGAGKTSLLERTIRDLGRELRLYVIEGDQATAHDSERIRAAGAPAVQVNTGSGCHLEADMIARGLQELRPSAGSIVMIENVGNLVCPALFDLGERAKAVILSVTEGEDKPLKYPHMFRAANLMILNKIDLLPHVDFDLPRAIANAARVQSGDCDARAVRAHRRGPRRVVRLAQKRGRRRGERGLHLTSPCRSAAPFLIRRSAGEPLRNHSLAGRAGAIRISLFDDENGPCSGFEA